MELYYENAAGTRLNLNKGDIRLISMDGAGAVSVINTSATSGYDGAAVISAQMPMRNIVLTLDLLGDIEANRLKLYDIFRAKQLGTLYYSAKYRDVKIECYTEKAPFLIDAANSEIQISLICPQPYFTSLEELKAQLAAEEAIFEFDYTFPEEFVISQKSASVMVIVVNKSEVDVGMRVVFYATSTVVNPSLLNVDTGEFIKLNFTMLTGDVIVIDTHRGKRLRINLNRSGENSNIINSIAENFTFTQLHPGDNLFRYNADDNLSGLEVTIYYEEYYAGV